MNLAQRLLRMTAKEQEAFDQDLWDFQQLFALYPENIYKFDPS